MLFGTVKKITSNEFKFMFEAWMLEVCNHRSLSFNVTVAVESIKYNKGDLRASNGTEGSAIITKGSLIT